MAVVDLVLERDFDDEKVWQIARTAGLKKQSAIEVVEAWAIIRIWSDLLEKRFGKIQSIRHHSSPNDPPDLEIICAERVVELEHTRLQPEHLGHFEKLKDEVGPYDWVSVPSISNPPTGRKAMIETMFSTLDRPWTNVSDEHAAIQNLLMGTLQRKMSRLRHGGIIGVIDCVTLADPAWLTQFATNLVSSKIFPDFEAFTLVTLHRTSPWHFYSALIEKGKPAKERRNKL